MKIKFEKNYSFIAEFIAWAYMNMIMDAKVENEEISLMGVLVLFAKK